MTNNYHYSSLFILTAQQSLCYYYKTTQFFIRTANNYATYTIRIAYSLYELPLIYDEQ